MPENAVRHAQAAHVGVLGRRDIEQTKIAPTEIIRWHWRCVGPRLILQPLIGVEGMLFALEPFLVSKLLAGRQNYVLRLDMRGIGAGRLGGGFAGRASAGEPVAAAHDLHTDRKTLEVALLFVGKVDGKSFELHDVRAPAISSSLRLIPRLYSAAFPETGASLASGS